MLIRSEIVPGDRIHVLLAEDTEATRRLIQTALEWRKFTIDTASTGEEAVTLFRNSTYDIVLTDVHMPVMDGITAVRRMRFIESKDQHRQRTPIVAITAAVMQRDRERCLAAGMDAYISKPIDLPQLVQTIEHLVARRRASAVVQESDGDTTRRSQSVVSSFNKERALERLLGDETLFRRLVRFFLDDHDGLVTQIQLGIEEAKADQVAHCAHTLKGLAATLDADSVVSIAQQIEDAAKRCDNGSLYPLLEQLEIEVASLTNELQAYMEVHASDE